ncbi:MAG: hypothetical protein Q9209_003651 [Squamulea sp. 1 TL-2023]
MPSSKDNQAPSGPQQDPAMKPKPAFTSIPQEIKSKILSFLEPQIQDLKNARLVCHQWANTAAQFLFKELWVTPATLSRLRDKRSIQTIQPHVKHVYFQTDLLPDTPFRVWRESNRSRPAKTRWTKPDLRARYDRYSHYSNLEKLLLVNVGANVTSTVGRDVMLGVLEEAIRSFNTLARVTIANRYWSTSSVVHSTIPRLHTWHKVWSDLDDLQLTVPMSHQMGITDTIFSSMLNFLSLSKKHPTHIDAGVLSLSLFDNPEECFPAKHLITNLFVGLTSIELELIEGRQMPKQVASFKMLNEYLASAEVLENLTLGFTKVLNMTNGYDTEPVDLLAHLSLTTPRLKMLTLYEISPRTASLQALILKHCKTLAWLELKDIFLMGGGLSADPDGLDRILDTVAATMNVKHLGVGCLHNAMIMPGATPSFPTHSFFMSTMQGNNATLRSMGDLRRAINSAHQAEDHVIRMDMKVDMMP